MGCNTGAHDNGRQRFIDLEQYHLLLLKKDVPPDTKPRHPTHACSIHSHFPCFCNPRTAAVYCLPPAVCRRGLVCCHACKWPASLAANNYFCYPPAFTIFTTTISAAASIQPEHISQLQCYSIFNSSRATSHCHHHDHVRLQGARSRRHGAGCCRP